MEGRSYRLRTRHLPKPDRPARNVILGAPANRALVSVTAQPAPVEKTLGPGDRLDYAWAAHQREYGERGLSVVRAVTGNASGMPAQLLAARRKALWLPDRDDFAEALLWHGRAVVEAFTPAAARVTAPRDHDCDCTCAYEPGHAAWAIAKASWRPTEVGALLRRLCAGERVRVRLGPAR